MLEGLAGVLFDMDGVLLDSSQAWYEVLCSAARQFGYPAVSFELFAENFGAGVREDIERFFPGLDEDRLRAYYHSEFAKQLAAVRPMPGVQLMLQTLRDAGLRLAVVTNTPRPTAELMLRDQGLAGYFQALAASGDAPEKPAPDLVLRAMSALELLADACIYVGDSSSDSRAAAAAGVRMVGMGRAGHWRIEALDELPQICRGA